MFIALSPLVSLVTGILILIFPRLLNFIVAIHLIIVGSLGLMHPYRLEEQPTDLRGIPFICATLRYNDL